MPRERDEDRDVGELERAARIDAGAAEAEAAGADEHQGEGEAGEVLPGVTRRQPRGLGDDEQAAARGHPGEDSPGESDPSLVLSARSPSRASP